MAYIISSGITSDGIILENDTMTVLDGGVANSTTAREDSYLFVSSGGVVNDTTLNDAGYLYLYDGGMANRTTVNMYGYLLVSSGGTVNGATVNTYGCLDVRSGGMVNDITVNESVELYLSSGATVNSATLNMSAGMEVDSGVVMNHTTVNSTTVEVYGTMNDTTINRGGRISAYDGVMSGVVVNPGGYFWVLNEFGATEIVENGGYVYYEDYSSVTFRANAFADVTLSAGDSATVHSGTTANSVTVDPGAKLEVFSGGIASNVVENGGYVQFEDDAQVTFQENTVSGVILTANDSATVHSGTTMNSATVTTGAKLSVFSGGVANDVVEDGGYVEFEDDAQVTFQAFSFLGLSLYNQSATLHSGTTAGNVVVSYGGRLLVAGGSADGVTVTSGGQILHTGGTATGIVASSGARLNFTVAPDTVFAGASNGIAFDIRDGVLSGYSFGSGVVTIASGAFATEVAVQYGGTLDVSGGTATHTVVSSGGTLNLFDGSANDLGVEFYGQISLSGGVTDLVSVSSGGSLTVAGGTATDIVADAGAYLNFTLTSDSIIQGSRGETAFEYLGGVLSDTVVEGIVLTVQGEGTSATGNTVGSDGELRIDGGTAAGNSVGNGGSILVFDGIASGTTVGSSGYLNVSSGGILTGTTVGASGYAYVSSGAVADDLFVDAYGCLSILAGATVTNLTAEEGAELSLDVSPDTFISGTYGGSAFEISGGSVSGYSIDCYGSLHVCSGGMADAITVNEGSLRIYEDGSADAITVNGGSLYVSSGGTATNIDWTPCEGRVVVNSGASATFVSQYSGVYYGSNNHLVSHAEVLDGLSLRNKNTVYVMSGGTANGAMVDYGSMYVNSGGTANGIIFNKGIVDVSSGGTVNKMQIIGNGKLTISCGVLNSTVVYNSAHLNILGGTVNDTVLNNYYASMTLFSGAAANNTVVKGGILRLSRGVTASNTTVKDGGLLSMTYEAVADGITVNPYCMVRVDAGTATNIVENGGFVSCTEGAIKDGRVTFVSNTFSGLHLESRCSASLHSGTTANSVVIDREGYLHISSGGKLTGKIITTSRSYLYVSSGGIIDFDVTNVKPGEYNAIITDAYSLKEYGRPNYTITVNADQAEGTYRLADNVYTSTFIRNPFTIVDAEGVELGTLSVGKSVTIGNTVYSLSLGYYSSSSQYSSLVLTVSNSGEDYYTADGLVLYRVKAYVGPGEVFGNTTILSSGGLYVSSGGKVKDTRVEYYGNLFISSGGKAEGTILDGGVMSVFKLGEADSTTVNPGGMLRINGGTATNIVENGGFVSCYDEDIRNGRVTFASNTVSGLYLSGQTATIHSGTTINSAIIDRDNNNGYYGGIIVFSGGKLTGRIMFVNGNITVSSGGILDFDITRTNPGATSALLNDYYSVKFSGTPNFTITVSDDQAEGLYRLADNLRNEFRYSISVVNTEGMRLGTLSMGQTALINGVYYTLGQEYMASSSSTSYNRYPSLVLYVGSNSPVADGYVLSNTEWRISSGLVLNNTIVTTYGRLYVMSGGTVNNTSVYARGSLTLSRGGAANNTEIYGSGFMDVMDGMVSGATVHSGGLMRITRGTVLDVVEDGGFVSCSDAANVTFASNTLSAMYLSSYSATVHSGTTANDAIIGYSGELRVFSSGVANGTMVTSAGRLNVSSGGIASDTTIFYNGKMSVSSGILAGRTFIQSGGYLSVAGGTATGIIAADGARLNFTVGSDTCIAGTSAGTAFEIRDGFVSGYDVTGYGTLTVEAGGTAEGVTVKEGGSLVVSSGGTATGIVWTPCEGSVTIMDGASASFVSQYSGAYYGSDNQLISSATLLDALMLGYDETVIVMSGGTANAASIDEGGEVQVFSGGVADGVSVNDYGYLTVFSGGAANYTWLRGGQITVSNGGVVKDTTELSGGGRIVVNDGGKAKRTMLSESGTLSVYSGGVAESVTLCIAANLYVYDGGTADQIAVNSDCVLHISSGGVASNVLLAAGGSIAMVSGATITGPTVYNGAAFDVVSGMTVTDIVESGGYVTIKDGAAATFRTNVISGLEIFSGNSASIHSGTTLEGTTVGVGSLLDVFSGGSAVEIVENGGCVTVEEGALVEFKANTITDLVLEDASATAHSGTTVAGGTIGTEGHLSLLSGGSAADTVISWNGNLHVSSGGMATGAVVNASGNLEVISGGTATGIVWTPGEGKVIVRDGGVATFADEFSGVYFGSQGTLVNHAMSMYDCVLYPGGSMYAFSGGTAGNTVVSSGGILEVLSGGEANSSFVYSSGIMTVSSGGEANSSFVYSSGIMTVSSGGVADYTSVTSFGGLHVSRGGVANNVTVYSAGSIFVEGGTAGITANAGARLYLTVAKDSYIAGTSGGTEFEFKDGLVSGYSIYYGSMAIESGVQADAVSVGYAGSLCIISGGTANSSFVYSSGIMTVSSGGVANNAVVNSYGRLNVSSGGVANSAGVNYYGNVNVSSGGVANDTVLNSFGYVYVSSGGTANRTVFSSSGILQVYSGGTATDTVVGSGASLNVDAGGTVTGITAEEGASLNFSISSETGSLAWTYAGSSYAIEGGVVSDFSFDYGSMSFGDGGTARNITVYGGGSVEFDDGGVADGVTVKDGGLVTVYYCDTAEGLVVSSGGSLSITGSTVIGITAEEGAYLSVRLSTNTLVAGTYAGAAFEYGGTHASGSTIGFGEVIVGSGCDAEDVAVSEAGSLRLLSGGRATGAILNGGSMVVSSGAMVLDTVVNGGYISVRSNATVTRTTVESGTIRLDSGAQANSTTINDGSMDVYSTGMVGNTVVNGGRLNVRSDGVANNTTVNSGSIYVRSASVNNTTIASGTFTLDSLGVANNTTVNSRGRLSITDGVASNTVVNSGGSVDIKRGLAKNLTANLGGVVSAVGKEAFATGVVENGGYVRDDKYATIEFASNTISGLVLSNTSASVHSCTTVEGAMVNGGLLEVFSGGTATGIVENGGYVRLQDGAVTTFKANVISGLEISEYSSASVHSRTSVNGVSIESGGGLDVFAGGTLSGRMTFMEGAAVYAYTGSVVNFDLTGTNAGSPALVNDLSAIYGTPEYTMTISADMGCGKYMLAAGAADFRKTITVQDMEGEELYYLSVGDWFCDDTNVYLLTVEDVADVGSGILTLTVAENARPVVDDIQVSTTAPTNEDVTITAIFSASLDLASCLYRIGGNGAWTNYDTAVTVSENTVVYFKAVDIAGNESEVVGCTVSNIDKVAPDKPAASADITAFTNGDVHVSAVFGDDSVVREYSLDGEEWTDYETSVEFTENGTVYFRAADEAGNVSDVTAFTVNNIDTTAPSAPSGLKAIVSDQTVALIWNVSTDDLAGVGEYIVTYSLDGQVFTAGTTGTGYLLNDVAYGTWDWNVQAVDAAGNESEKTAGEAFTVSESVTPGPQPDPGIESKARNDINGNGISDVTFQWTGGDCQIGFWLDGSSQWQSQSQARSADWRILGTYDVDANGKADLLMAGRATIVDMTGMYIGYYEDSIDTSDNWHTIGFLSSANDWCNAVGNLTGENGKNSIVWYAPELYALGAWTDGTDSWITLSNSFGGDDWTLVGCGDFDGDGKDSVLMTYNGGQMFYSVGIDSAEPQRLGFNNWSGWEVRAIGDFAGDGKDDIVLFHKESGSMVMLADGNLDDFTSIGQLDAKDWFVVGAGDYNGDQQDDLLVRQYSTGMLGYYDAGDVADGWVEMGRGVDMDWTVIA